ncbi:hypothetical protein KEM56_006501 [Ascosphaera pollenicola]|nr:hypothetical protein KEM56_006501 [Ascosphaera pollenicola]
MFHQPPLGSPVPPDTPHAVSVSLPSWDATVGYEEGEDWVVKAMTTGYPRFFIHKSIQALTSEIIARFGNVDDTAMLWPSEKAAETCRSFMVSKVPAHETKRIRIVGFVMPESEAQQQVIVSNLFCVVFPQEYFPVAKQVWQHSGDGISSRRSEFLLKALQEGHLSLIQKYVSQPDLGRVSKGPRRYQKEGSSLAFSRKPQTIRVAKKPAGSDSSDGSEFDRFIEERFGRNLDATLADKAKLAVKRRISGSLRETSDLHVALSAPPSEVRIAGLTEDDVYLYPTGMSSIFNTHQILLKARGQLHSICFGFPYVDTLKILQKWGPGVTFCGTASSEELDKLESRLESGERYLALFTEFPGNPLLMSPDLERIRRLADKYDFAVVVDESIGSFVNVNVLPFADVVVSSLTKIFSGDSNVMGGSAVLNPNGRYYNAMKEVMQTEYEDNYWAEDALVLERNSRDFVSRIHRINAHTEAATKYLRSSPLGHSSKPCYDRCKNAEGGYGGLFSVVFHEREQAKAFFDTLEVMKGPSLGTNFTLCCPFTILAHYAELDWAESYGVSADLVRIAVGLEEEADLLGRLERALEAADKVARPN